VITNSGSRSFRGPLTKSGLQLAAAAIDDVARLRSGRARELRLASLADTLDARPSSDYRDLVRQAREVAAIRA
jgi:hypothetical protein